MKRRAISSIIYSLIIVALFSVQNVFSATIKKEIEVETKDNFIIKATVCYPKTKTKKKIPTVVLLHSLGYSSSRWTTIQDSLTKAGYAWVMIDLRGHGKSVYTSSLKKVSWLNLKMKAFSRYPADVLAVLKEVEATTKKLSFNNWAIIGGDIGANTAVLVAKDMPKKPSGLVLISPSTSYKGLYIPIAMTELGRTPILAIASTKDNQSMASQNTLKKFAQGEYEVINVDNNGSGMMLIKQEPELADMIVKWLDARMMQEQQ